VVIDRARPVLIGVVVAFLLLVGLRIHGYSLPAWHAALGSPDAPEILLGHSQGVRADHYAAILPLALAQSVHDPAFPLVNRNVGFGQNMLLPVALPVARPATLFRPEVWGWFLGDDVGLAWQWWYLTLGLFAAWFGVLLVVSGGRRELALAGSVLLVASPFVQFWSLIPAPTASTAGFTILASLSLLLARSRAAILASGLWLGWSAASFVLALYWPFQVPLVYLGAVVLAGLWLERLREIDLRREAGARALALLLAAVVVGLAGLTFWLDAGDAIQRMSQTVYPGGRVATGGDRPSWLLLSGNFAFAWRVQDFGALRNICETASYWLFSPVVAGAFAVNAIWRREGPDLLSGLLLGFCAALWIYSAMGIPEPLARAFQLSHSPAARANVALGVADIVLLVRYLSRGHPLPMAGAAVVAAGFAGLLLACGIPLRRALPEVSWSHLIAASALNGALAFLFVAGVRRRAALALLAGLCSLSTLWFNPVCRGGSAYLRDNALAREILRIDQEAGGGTVWVAYSAPLIANLFRVLGVRCVNGVLPTPPLEAWQRVDPEGRNAEVYDRYAHVVVEPQAGPEVRFELVSVDHFRLTTAPRNWQRWFPEVSHVLAQTGQPERFARRYGLDRLFSVGWYHLYRIGARQGGARAKPRGEPAR